MMATAQAKKLEDPFRDESMKVPLCGEPGYQHPDAGDDFYDPRFAGLDTRGSGMDSKGLKEFLSNPDRESILDTRDPELVAEYNRQHAVSVVHCAGVPFQVKQRDGKWFAKGDVDGQIHRFTADTRDEVLSKAMRCIQENTVPAPRNLTAAEKMAVVRRVQAGDLRGAFIEYMRLAIGEERADGYENENAFLSDPALQPAFDDATLLIWFAARPAVEDSPEFHSFLSAYRGGRPLNLDLLDAAHAAWKAHAEKRVRADAVARFTKQEEPTPGEIADGLEEMTDAQLDAQYKAVVRARAAR